MVTDRRHMDALLARSGRQNSPERARHGRYAPSDPPRPRTLPTAIVENRPLPSPHPVSWRRYTRLIPTSVPVIRHRLRTPCRYRTRPSTARGAAQCTQSVHPGAPITQVRIFPAARCLGAVARLASSRPPAHTATRPAPPRLAPYGSDRGAASSSSQQAPAACRHIHTRPMPRTCAHPPYIVQRCVPTGRSFASSSLGFEDGRCGETRRRTRSPDMRGGHVADRGSRYMHTLLPD
jgi:hypothetical protein